MIKNNDNLRRIRDEAQTFIEYTLLLSIVTILLISMTPLVRRGVQGMVKGVADQVGLQQNADQHGGDRGYLVSTGGTVTFNRIRNVRERLGDITYNFIIDETASQTEQFSDLGRKDSD